MKKLGKKLSFLTKIMLVVGLLISNLSSLSVVFAYEVSDSMVIDLVDDNLKINYTEELAEDVENVSIKVYENYTYLNGVSEEEVFNSYSLDAAQMESALEGNLELEYKSIFADSEVETEGVENFRLFDGTYSVKVEIVEVTTLDEIVAVETTEVDAGTELLAETTEEVIATGEFEKEMTHESGLNIKLFDSEGTEISLVDGSYPVTLDNSEIEVVAQVLAGGLNPTDIFVYDETEYLASDLLQYEFKSKVDFSGHLFGEYVLPVSVTLLKVLETNETEESSEIQYEEVVYTDSLNVIYESYELNAALLNQVLVNEELGETYMFYSDTKDGVLYVLPDLAQKESTVRTVLDLYTVLNTAVGEDDTITYQVLKDGVDVLSGYDATTATQTLDEYLTTVELDETVVVSLSNDGLTVTYKVVVAADLNSDNALTEEDLLELINQVVGESEVTNLEKSDLYIDDEVNTLDVLYLNQVIKTQVWGAELSESDAVLDASLNVLVDGTDGLVSGDEFTVEYVVSLTENEVSGFSGLFEYDKEALELVSVVGITDWLGNYGKDSGKFLYLGEESLTGPEEVLPETSETETTESEMTETETAEVVAKDYVVLTAKFKALKAGTHTVTVKDNEYFNDATYLVLAEDLVASTSVVVSASEDNTLSYLEVAGQQITLEEGKYDYELTVSNDVTLVDLKYTVANVAANVTSTVFPEELAEGNNTVVVTVTSESGVSQDYTITVVREAAPEEETTTQVNNNYYNDYENEEEEEVIVTPEPEEEEEVELEEEESNLSKIVITILILLVIVGLIYLIFKDDDDEETKKANKEVNKLKKEPLEPEVKNTSSKTTNKENSSSKSNSNKNKKNNNKKER